MRLVSNCDRRCIGAGAIIPHPRTPISCLQGNLSATLAPGKRFFSWERTRIKNYRGTVCRTRRTKTLRPGRKKADDGTSIINMSCFRQLDLQIVASGTLSSKDQSAIAIHAPRFEQVINCAGHASDLVGNFSGSPNDFWRCRWDRKCVWHSSLLLPKCYVRQGWSSVY